MTKTKLIMLVGLCFVHVCSYAKVGLGVSINEGSSKTYIPIQISKNLEIEPIISYYKDSFESRDWKSEYETIGFELGLTAFEPISDQHSYYYGTRIGKFERKYRSSTSQDDTHGYSLAPMVGYRYALTDHFNLSAEASLGYERFSRDYDITFSGYTEKNRNIQTKLIARYYFE